ncbi:MAG: RNA polymerase sigma factor [Draconibacterium sp.]
MEEGQLVQQVLSGNNNAFRFLVSKYQRLVVHVVGRIVQQQEELEDICQEVFIKVFKTLNKFRGDSKLSTWIATIAYNTAITHLRKKSRRGELSYNEEPMLIGKEADTALNQQAIEKEEIKKHLLKLIETLPVHYRTVLTLYHLEEFSYREIVEITGMPEGTIKSYLNRARMILKGKMEKIARLEQTNIFADYA